MESVISLSAEHCYAEHCNAEHCNAEHCMLSIFMLVFAMPNAIDAECCIFNAKHAECHFLLSWRVSFY
jgi:hypothetical protein